MIKKFDSYNESVRDEMKPKSKEDIKKSILSSLDGMTPIEQMFSLYRNNRDETILPYISTDTIKDIINKILKEGNYKKHKNIIWINTDQESFMLFINTDNYKIKKVALIAAGEVASTLKELL